MLTQSDSERHEHILQKLRPLFLKNLQGVPIDWQDDFLQEYMILCLDIIRDYEQKHNVTLILD